LIVHSEAPSFGTNIHMSYRPVALADFLHAFPDVDLVSPRLTIQISVTDLAGNLRSERLAEPRLSVLRWIDVLLRERRKQKRVSKRANPEVRPCYQTDVEQLVALSWYPGQGTVRVSKYVGELIELGLITSEPAPLNARKRILTLTDQGRRCLEMLYAERRLRIDHILHQLKIVGEHDAISSRFSEALAQAIATPKSRL